MLRKWWAWLNHQLVGFVWKCELFMLNDFLVFFVIRSCLKFGKVESVLGSRSASRKSSLTWMARYFHSAGCVSSISAEAQSRLGRSGSTISFNASISVSMFSTKFKLRANGVGTKVSCLGRLSGRRRRHARQWVEG